MPHRVLLALAALPLAGAAPLPPAELTVRVEGLRDLKGKVMICLTRRADFLACDNDADRVARVVPAARAALIGPIALPAGEWSLLLVHDENGNGRLDKWMGMPREGFGFSRNPTIRFGPPSLGQVRFALASGAVEKRVTVKYLL